MNPESAMWTMLFLQAAAEDFLAPLRQASVPKRLREIQQDLERVRVKPADLFLDGLAGQGGLKAGLRTRLPFFSNMEIRPVVCRA